MTELPTRGRNESDLVRACDIAFKKYFKVKAKIQLFFLALLIIILGLAFYTFCRPHDSVYLFLYLPLPDYKCLDNNQFCIASSQSPSFIHVFSFSIFSSLVFPVCTRGAILASCLFWTFVNCLFEIGQLAKVSLQKEFLEKSNGVPFLDNIGPYFTNGTFDIWDIFACLLGGFSAFFILNHMLIQRRSLESNATPQHFNML